MAHPAPPPPLELREGFQSAQEVTRTYDCHTPNCTGEATSPVGRYSYCARCRLNRKLGAELPTHTFVEKLEELQELATKLDQQKARAKKLTQQALDARNEARETDERLQRALNELPRSVV